MTTAFVKPEASAVLSTLDTPVVIPGYSIREYSYGFENYASHVEQQVVAAQVIYTQGFEGTSTTNPDGWVAAGFTGSSSNFNGGGHTGVKYMNTSTATTNTPVERTFSGLTVGRTYTFSVWCKPLNSGAFASTGVAGIGSTDAIPVPTATWTELVFAFTATSTTHVLQLRCDYYGIGWDDITVTRDAYPVQTTVVDNDGRDGWSSGSVVSTAKRSGTYSLSANAPARAFTGLVVGHSYTLRAWFAGDTSAKTWVEYKQTFTAVATSMSRTLNVPWLTFWDDVSLTHHYPAVSTRTPALPIAEGRVTLDENYAPHVQATVEVPLTSLDLLEVIDPRKPLRVALTASEEISGTTRTFDLGLRSRTVDHKSGRVSLELASDEALLLDKRRLAGTVDGTPRTYESSVRAVCEWALSKVPAIPRNVEDNPRALSTGSLSAFGTRFGWVRSFILSGAETAPLPFGTLARFTSPETGLVGGRGVDSYGNSDLASPLTSGDWVAGPVVTAGETITVSRYVRMNVTSPGYLLGVRFHNGAGAWVGGSAQFSEVTGAGTGTGWVRVSWTGTVPAGATRFASTVRVVTLNVTTTTFLDMTGLMTERSDIVRPWRDQAIEPGSTDADVTATWDATNLQTNPAAGTLLDGWTAQGGSLSRITTGAFPAGITTAVRATMDAGSALGPYFQGGDNPTVSGGNYNVSIFEKQLYRVSAWVRTSAAKTLRLSVQTRNSAGGTTGTRHSTPLTTTANTWHRITFVMQAPPGAVAGGVYSYLTSGTYTAGQTADITGVTITEGTQDVPFFTGSSSDSRYAYSWEGAAHLSASTRRALVPRPPEAFDWKPGQSVFDFVQPLLEASGLRLYCDEKRVWRLIDPATYEVPGYVVVQSGHNATEGTDTVSRNTDDWATGVLVHFHWADAQGVQREAFDFAGTDDKVLTVERDTEYPGPGTAKYILQSLKGRGRVQDVVALTDLGTTPSQDVTINLPGALSQTGKVRRVTFGLKTGLMELGTRGLTDALPGTWALWNPTQTWSAVDPTLKWKDA